MDSALKVYRAVYNGIWDFYAKYTPEIVSTDMAIKKPYLRHIYPWTMVFIYILMLIYLPKIQKKVRFMLKKDEKTGKWIPTKTFKWIFIMWNFALSFYSGVTFLFFAVDTLKIMDNEYQYSIFKVICSEDCLYFGDNRPNIFWGVLFAISKYFEMIDTLLLILKNPERTPRFLHWYHHITVLFLTWYAETWNLSLGTIAILMNSFIHLNMYYYYAMTGLGRRPKWAFILTIGQVLQMFVGVTNTIVWSVAYFVFDIKCCCDNLIVMAIMGVIYGSYLYLFLEFMFQRYFSKGKKKEKKKKQK